MYNSGMHADFTETNAHTTSDGKLHLDLDLGVPDADVKVTVRVISTHSHATQVDANGWPIGYFELAAGSMPELERAPQGEFEERIPLT